MLTANPIISIGSPGVATCFKNPLAEATTGPGVKENEASSIAPEVTTSQPIPCPAVFKLMP